MMPKDIAEIATERASHYAPLPPHEPSHAGGAGAFIVGCIVAVFAGFAGLDLDEFAGAAGASIILGFLGPFAYYISIERKHYDAWSKEYEALRKETGNSS